MQTINLGIRFILELVALGIYGYWGYEMGAAKFTRIMLGLGIPAVVAVAWGVFGSPKAPVRLAESSHFVFEFIVFGLPAILLFSAGKTMFAYIYALAVIINKILMVVWQQ